MFDQRIVIKNSRPVVRKRGIRYFDYHDEDIYSKGSWVLHTLRYTINNDSLFFDILKSFRIANNQKQILSEAFIDFVNKKTGKDYTWFFKQYLFKREAPMLEYYWFNNDAYYRWTKVDDDFVMPIEIELNKEIIKLYPTTKIQKIELKMPGKMFEDNSDHLYYGHTENKKLRKQFVQ
jgi:aminopeptidase N